MIVWHISRVFANLIATETISFGFHVQTISIYHFNNCLELISGHLRAVRF